MNSELLSIMSRRRTVRNFTSESVDQEKIDNPTFHTIGGYLKSYEYKEAFLKSWNEATIEDRKLVEDLPNFELN